LPQRHRTPPANLSLSLDAARALHLAAQGLAQAPVAPATKAGVLGVIRRMGALQIDTIHVVARSPYLVLWSRLGSYDPAWLDELLAEGAIFEYWAHAACFLPTEDFPLYRRRMLDGLRRGGWRHSHDWLAAHADEIERLLSFVRANGPVRSADFERTDGRVGTWWDWKPEKLALEHLHNVGELMTARRHNFQRLYDLRERVLPTWDDARTATIDETLSGHALAAVRALGVTTAAWVPDYFRIPKTGSSALLSRLADEGALLQAQIDGMATPAYVHPDHLALAKAAAAGDLRSEVTTLLTPFDPIVWDRDRARALFDFDYTIECYTPAPKRRYGYFTLPILHRGALVGRLDPKAHRKEGVFEVKSLHLEPGVALSDTLIDDLAATLRACAAWHRTPNVVVSRSDPPELAAALERAVSAG
jgi:uncharacterized protein YcaQ